MDAKARSGPCDEQGRRCDRAMDPSLLQQFTALGLSMGGPSGVLDSREAWNPLARIRARWMADCGWRLEWKAA
eukprot:1112070-Alexandrium_andersonii.AAC.1